MSKLEKVWTRTGQTRTENTPRGVIQLAEEVSGKSQRWVAISYTSNNSKFNRGIYLWKQYYKWITQLILYAHL